MFGNYIAVKQKQEGKKHVSLTLQPAKTTSWCMYVYMYACIYVCLFAYMYLCMHDVHMQSCMYVRMDMYVCMDGWMHECMRAYYVCLYVCIYAFVCIYVYMCSLWFCADYFLKKKKAKFKKQKKIAFHKNQLFFIFIFYFLWCYQIIAF